MAAYHVQFEQISVSWGRITSKAFLKVTLPRRALQIASG